MKERKSLLRRSKYIHVYRLALRKGNASARPFLVYSDLTGDLVSHFLISAGRSFTPRSPACVYIPVRSSSSSSSSSSRREESR